MDNTDSIDIDALFAEAAGAESASNVWVEPDWEADASAAEAPAAEPTAAGAPAPAFDLEKFRYPGPWPEEIPDEADCLVINGKGATAKELLTGKGQPVLAVKGYLWAEIRHLVNLTPGSEMAMFLILKQFASLVPKWLAVDLFFPKQEVGPNGVSIDAPSVNSFYETLHAHEDYSGNDMHRRIAHLHSHASMGTSWSAADDAQQMSRDDLGYYDDFRFYLVTNVRGDVKCSFVQYQPFLRRFDNLPVVVVGAVPELSGERKAELESWVKERTSPLVTDVFSGLRDVDYKAFTEEYVPKQKPEKREYGNRFGYSYGTYGTYGAYGGCGSSWSEGGRKAGYLGDALDAYGDEYAYGWDEKSAKRRKRKAKRHAACTFGPLLGRRERAEPEEREPIIGEFVDWCSASAGSSMEYDGEDAKYVLRALEDSGIAAVDSMLEAVRSLDPVDREYFIEGFAGLMGREERDLDKLADDLVGIAQFLDFEEKTIDRLLPFFRDRL